MSKRVSRKSLLHDFPRHWTVTDEPVVSQIAFRPFLKVGTLSFLHSWRKSIQDFPSLHEFSKMIENGLKKDITHLSQYSCQPVTSQRHVAVQFSQAIPASIIIHCWYSSSTFKTSFVCGGLVDFAGKDEDKEDIKHFSPNCVYCHKITHPIQQRVHIFLVSFILQIQHFILPFTFLTNLSSSWSIFPSIILQSSTIVSLSGEYISKFLLLNSFLCTALLLQSCHA